MTDIAGVSIKKKHEGKVTYLIFDVEKNKDFLQPVLKDLGIVEKSKFRQDFEKAIPIKESKRKMIEHIQKYYEDKH